MRYFFIHRALPSPNFKYPDRFDWWERLGADEIKHIKYVGKPIVMEHMVEIGKLMFEWHGKDGSKYALSYVEDSNFFGSVAIEELKRNLITGMSPSYRVNVKKDQFNLDIKKDYIELSLVDDPDFKGKGACNIFYGASENDLNIKLNDLLKLNTNNVAKPNTELSEGLVTDLKSFLKGLEKSTMTQPNNPTLNLPATPAQEAPRPSDPVNEQQKPTGQQVQDIGQFVAVMNSNPRALDTLDVDDTKKGLLLVCKELTDVQEKLKNEQAKMEQMQQQYKTGQSNTAQDSGDKTGTKRKEMESVDLMAEEANRRAEFKKQAAELLTNRMGSTRDTLQKYQNFYSESQPEVEKLKETMDKLTQVIANDPMHPAATLGAQVVDGMGLVMAHAANRFENNSVRREIQNYQTEVDANQLKRFIHQSSQQPKYEAKTSISMSESYSAPKTIPSNEEADKRLMERVFQKISQGKSGVKITQEATPLYGHNSYYG